MGVLRASERGQATVEAAFLIPVLFTVLLLSVQPGMVLYDRMVMQAAASDACRLAAVKTDAVGDSSPAVEALPVLLAVAAISVNALAFFGWCAAFDDDFRDSVRVYAASPAYGQGVGDTCALIERALDERLDAENVSVSVSAHGVSAGHTSFSATLEYAPTLFGLGLKSEVMGVALPKLSHTEELVVDCYKPGVLL